MTRFSPYTMHACPVDSRSMDTASLDPTSLLPCSPWRHTIKQKKEGRDKNKSSISLPIYPPLSVSISLFSPPPLPPPHLSLPLCVIVDYSLAVVPLEPSAPMATIFLATLILSQSRGSRSMAGGTVGEESRGQLNSRTVWCR